MEMRDHTDCSQFYPTKRNFPKKSLDISFPQTFPQTLLKFPIKGQILPNWDPCAAVSYHCNWRSSNRSNVTREWKDTDVERIGRLDRHAA